MYILETGERLRINTGFGTFSINKKKRKRRKGKNDEYVNLVVDWQKSKKLGKRVYNMNHHTDGYFFGWQWFRQDSVFKLQELWYFKASRTTSRLLAHYLKTDTKYQHIYKEYLK